MKKSPRLVWGLLALVLVGAVCGGSVVLSDVLWNTDASAGTILITYLGWGLAILLTSIAAARAVAYLLFPSKAGFQTVSQQTDSDDQLVRKVSVVQASTLIHSVLVVALLFGTTLLANHLSRGALFSTRRVMLEALSRSTSAEDLHSLFAQTREMYLEDDTVYFTKLLPSYFDASDPSVARDAMETAAIMARRMNLALAALNEQRTLLGERWEPKLLAWFRTDLAPQLRLRLAAGKPPMLETVKALVWVADPADLALFERMARFPQSPPEIRELAALGLGNLGVLEGAEGILWLIQQADPEISPATLYYALGNIAAGLRNDPTDPETLDEQVLAFGLRLMELTKGATPQHLCLLVRTVALLEHQGLTSRLTELFESPASDLECPRVEYVPPTGAPVLLATNQSLRLMLANALADVAVQNDALRTWLPKALANPDITGPGREALEALQHRLNP